MKKDIIYKEISPNYWVLYNKNTGETLFAKGRINRFDPDKINFIIKQKKKKFDARLFFSTIVINTTEACNLRCRYCSRHKENYKKEKTITDDVLYTILTKAIKYAKLIKNRTVIQFHGGEPLIIFEKIKRSLQKIKKSELRHLDLRIQTNGTLITDDILKFCIKYNIHLGISIDGPPEINGINRRFADGSPVSNLLEEKINKVKNRLPRNHVSCLSVLTKANINDAKKVFNYVLKNKINDVSFLPLYPDFSNCINVAKDVIPRTKDAVSFSNKIFDLWIKRLKNNNFISVPNFQIWIWNLLGKNAGYITNNTSCGVGQSMIFIDTDGEIYPCGPFSYKKNMSMGNIKNMNIEQIKKTKIFQLFNRRKTIMIDKCKDCALQGICLGGCPANSYRKYKDIYKRDPFCPYWKGVIKHIIKAVIDNPETCNQIPEFSIRL